MTTIEETISIIMYIFSTLSLTFKSPSSDPFHFYIPIKYVRENYMYDNNIL